MSFKLVFLFQIADFGMARDLDEHNYYVSKGGKIPVKWTALEVTQLLHDVLFVVKQPLFFHGVIVIVHTCRLCISRSTLLPVMCGAMEL